MTPTTFTISAQVWEQLAQELERYDSLLAERSRRIRTVKSLQVNAHAA